MKPAAVFGAIAIAGLCATAHPMAAAEIRTGAGLCLDVHKLQIGNNGARVQVWGCNGEPQQDWTYDPTTRTVYVVSGRLFCLDVHAPDMAKNGGRVQVWACHGAPQQQWTPLANGSLRNAGGLCLDVHAPDQASHGARVQVWQCNGSIQQRFVFGPGTGAPNVAGQSPSPVAPTDTAEIHTGAGLCLDVREPEMHTNGGRVEAWTCNGRANQRWGYDAATRAVRISSGLCLDVHAGINQNGNRVQVWSCNGQWQQRWTPLANGSLRSAGGLCLDVHGADQTRNGARVQVWQCNGSQQQRFVFGPGGGAPSLVGQGPVPPPPAVTPPAGVTPPPVAAGVDVNDVRQWRVENSDTVLGMEPYELHNMRRRALNLTSQLGHKHWDLTLNFDLEDIGWMGSSGGHFMFVRTNTNDHRPIAPDEGVALYNTKIKKYIAGCWKLAEGGPAQGYSDRYMASWTSAPYYAWMVRHRVGADFALYNFKRGEYLVLTGASNFANLGYTTSQPPFRCK